MSIYKGEDRMLVGSLYFFMSTFSSDSFYFQSSSLQTEPGKKKKRSKHKSHSNGIRNPTAVDLLQSKKAANGCRFEAIEFKSPSPLRPLPLDFIFAGGGALSQRINNGSTSEEHCLKWVQ